MVSSQKKAYMKRYNKLPVIKAKKAGYMRIVRAKKDEEASRSLVRFLLDTGFEGLAFEYAQERCPEMLAVAKVRMDRKV